MADGYIRVPPDSTGKYVDTEELTVSAVLVERQRFRIAGAAATDLAPVDGTNGLAVDAKTLPPGAATATKQDTGNTSLTALAAQSLDYDTGGGTAAQVIFGVALPASGGPVAGGTATNPIQVSLANTGANGTAVVVSAATLPLPSGAATATNQTGGGQKTQIVDGSGNVIGATSNALDINIKSGNPTTIAATQSGTWTVQPGNTANTTAWKVDGSAVTQPISAASLPLPTGAAAKVALAIAAIQATASGDSTLVASGTRKLKRVEASNSHATTALTAGLKVPSLNGGSVFGKKYLPAAGGLAVWVFPDDYLQVTSEAVSVNLSAAGQIEVTAYYE